MLNQKVNIINIVISFQCRQWIIVVSYSACDISLFACVFCVCSIFFPSSSILHVILSSVACFRKLHALCFLVNCTNQRIRADKGEWDGESRPTCFVKMKLLLNEHNAFRMAYSVKTMMMMIHLIIWFRGPHKSYLKIPDGYIDCYLTFLVYVTTSTGNWYKHENQATHTYIPTLSEVYCSCFTSKQSTGHYAYIHFTDLVCIQHK